MSWYGKRAETSTSRPPGFRVLLVLGGLSTFGPLSSDLYLPALPDVGADLHAGQGLAQLTISTSLIGLALGQLVAGPISDNFGRRRPLLVGLVAFVALSLICAASGHIWVLIVARFLQGFAGAAGLVLACAMVRDLFGGVDAARVYAKLTVISGLAPIVAPLLGAQLVRIMPWQGLFLVLAGIGLVLLAGAMTLSESLSPARRRADGLRETITVGVDLLRSRPFVGYCLASGLSVAALMAYISASPFVLQQGYGVSAQVFSFVFATNSVGIVLLGQLGGRLTIRVGSARLLLIGLLVQTLAGLGILVVGISGTRMLLVLAVPLFVQVASFGLTGPHSTALALAPHPDVAGLASALLGASQFLFAGLLSPLGSVGARASAVPMGLAVSVMAGAGLVSYLLLTTRSDSTVRFTRSSA